MRYFLFILISIVGISGCSPKKAEDKPSVKEAITQQKPADVTEQEEFTEPEKIVVKEEITEEIETSSDLWQGYNQAKENLKEAKENGKILQIKKYLLDAAFYAKKLNRPDIEAWQYNNIGFYSIEEFKKRTDYDSKMNELSTMKPTKEKEVFHTNLKAELLKEFNLLEDAEKYLLISKRLDDEHSDDSRTAMIKSNLNFVKFTKDFTDN
jgi:hypothetical protein